MPEFKLSKQTENRIRARGRLHVQGLCGGYASICADCAKDQFEEMLAWARENIHDAPESKDIGAWWRAHNGPFLDEWYHVAWTRVKELKED